MGVLLVWLGLMPLLSDEDVCTDFDGLPEASSSAAQPDLFPPGVVRCEYTAPNGNVTERAYVPWFE